MKYLATAALALLRSVPCASSAGSRHERPRPKRKPARDERTRPGR